MSVDNRLSQQAQKPKGSVFVTDTGEITLDQSMVRGYLVNGNGTVTDQEVMMFIALCKGQKLNPFLREAYLIKYGDSQPATMVVSKDVYQKRADGNPDYDGKKSGIIVLDESNEIQYRNGTFYINGIEKLLGGWCEVFRKNRTHPERVEVSFNEYVGRKKDGSINGQWTTKPATMIRKVAIAQALRETFPKDLNGLYTAEEMNIPDTFETQVPVSQEHIEAVEEKTAIEEPSLV